MLMAIIFMCNITFVWPLIYHVCIIHNMHTHSHMRTHTCTHTHMRTHTCAHTHMRTHTHAHTHTCAHTHVHTHVHTHTHTHTVNLSTAETTNKLKIYQEYFEKTYIAAARDFYKTHAPVYLAENGVQNYMKYVRQLYFKGSQIAWREGGREGTGDGF